MRSAPLRLVRKDPWLCAVVVCAICYTVVVLWLMRNANGLPPDAVDYAEAARSLARGQGLTINRVVFHTGFFPSIRHVLELHALLQPLLIAPLFWIGGPDIALVRIPSVIFSASLGVLVFLVGRRFFGTFAGLIATVLVYTHANLLFVTLFATDDAGLALFSFAAIACFVVGLERGRRAWFVAAGLCSALAALEKYSGIVLPGVFTAVLAVSPRLRRAVKLGDWLGMTVPVAAVAVLFAIRNHLASGTLGSSYGALEWLGKVDMSAYFAYYPQPPTASQVWAQMGPGRVLGLIGQQFGKLGEAVRTDWLVLLGGLTTLWLPRRHLALGLCAIFYSIAIVFVICIVHHVEARYLSGLVPVYAIAIGAAVASVLSFIERRAPSARAVSARIAALAFGVFAVVAFGVAFRITRVIGQGAKAQICPDAIQYLRSSVDSNAPVLTSNAWLIAWQAERPAITAPTNGDEALMQVVQRYKVHWAFTGAELPSTLQLDGALHSPRVAAELRPERVFDGASCDVYKLGWGTN